MSNAFACVKCGEPIPADAAETLCPHCLLQMALDPFADGDLELGGRSAAETPAERHVRIGPYRLIRLLGEGGMGMVHLAEQVELVRRQVALKVIKPGLDSAAIVARFEAERQAIALMEHPSIARIYDAGVTQDGRPYFAMEYVAGLPITDYCDRERLPVRARLALFADVCAAVQHAHEKGIIHRDLKPPNVLVTVIDGRPLPKIIDFGVAKAITTGDTQRPSVTEFGGFVGTPEYMSPERVDVMASDVDLRSDVYSLGVVLYELLTGRLPFNSAHLRISGYEEIRRIIQEEEPPRPSARPTSLGVAASEIAERRGTTIAALLRALRGDLDWICMKCLEKDRRRRYGSAAELCADVRLFLACEPVAARPPTVPYRVRKYIRRHRIGVAVSAAIGAALAVGFGSSALLSSRAAAGSVNDHAVKMPSVEVVTRTGRAGAAAVSRDGRKVVYHYGNPGSQGLWLADVDTGNTERLPIPEAAHYNYPQWSRSGEHLYVWRYDRPDDIDLLRYSFASQRLETMSELKMEWVTVSPDERRVAGVRNDHGRASSSLIVANLDGSEERTLATRSLEEPYFLLAWAPDGRTIAASAGNLGIIGKPMRVVAVDVVDGRERMLSDEKWTRVGAKAWLPDGSGLLVLGQKWGEIQRADSWLWRLDVATGVTRSIPIGPDELSGWFLSLSADGQSLAASRTRMAANLWVAHDQDRGSAREIGAAWEAPRFLPDGRLVFTGPDQFLWRVKPDGTNRVRVGSSFHKAVARDVPVMVFSLADRDSVSQIWRADLDGRNPVQITYGAAATKPDISADGVWVAYVTAVDGALWKIRSAGGEPHRLASGVVSDPAWSPDGQWVAVRLRESTTRRWIPALVSATDGGVVRRLPLPPGTDLWHLRFSRDGRALDVALNDSQAGNVWRLPLDGSAPPRPLTHFTSDELSSFDWSWDGKLLACVRGGWRGELVLLRDGW